VPIKSNTNRIIRQAYSADKQAQFDLGTHDFLLVMHCCSYSHFHGFGGNGEIPVTTKFAGLGMVQTSNL